MSRPPPRAVHRWWLFGGGALLGLVAAFLAPSSSGCVYHDTCIKVTSPGHDWCSNLALAKQWPVGGSFEDAESIVRPDGFPPRGCRCYNDAENGTLETEIPECRYDGFVDELEQAARQECEALVMPDYDHNCWTVSGSQASIVEEPNAVGAGACIGNCEYGAAPAGGSCPAPNPYECATGDGGDDGCDPAGDGATDTGDSGVDDTSDTSGDTSGGLLFDIDAFVACDGRRCEIDETFARRLYHDPSPLLARGARLVYHTKAQRHVLTNVEPGSLAHALGLRTGDQLESVDGMVIDDLDSALQAYAQLGDATELEVRVKRGSQWLDFTYSFVQ